jgi:DNA-binding NarL/FixJ family response regulator
MAMRIQLGIVEDHHLVREGLRLVLSTQPDLEVVGEASDAAEAFQLLEQEVLHVVLLDLTLGDVDGIQLLRSMLERRPDLKVVVVTMHRDAETVRQALLAGARGYVVKGAHSSELFEAIRAVMRGERYLHSSVTSPVVDDSVRWFQAGPISPREREILSLLAAGHSAADIGRSIGISIHTVRRHIANLTGKLDVHGTPALVRYAERHGLVRRRE